MKIFISSVIKGFEDYREEAVAAIRSLHHTVVRAEDFGAQDSSPQVTCLVGVRKADVVILLLGERYGWPQASGLSATHEEYREARERKPVLAFVKENAAFEPRQAAFVKEVQDWALGLHIAHFSDPESLRIEVTSALRDLELEQATHPFDVNETLKRAHEAIPEARHGAEARLVISVASGPSQSVLRPGQLGDTLADDLQQEAMFGTNKVFDQGSATAKEVKGDWLWLRQDHAELGVDQLGDIVLVLPAVSKRRQRAALIQTLIEEDLQDLLLSGLKFATWVLDKIDLLSRLSHSVVVVSLLDASYLGWRTRAETDANPNSVTLGSLRQDPLRVQLSPPSRRRQELRRNSKEMAEDLTVLLRRACQR